MVRIQVIVPSFREWIAVRPLLDTRDLSAILSPMSWSRTTTGSLVLAACITTATLSAQGVRLHVGAALGRAVPTGNYHGTANGDGFDAAWQGMAFVAFTLPRAPLGLRVDGTFGTNGANARLKSDLTAQLNQPTDEQAKLIGGNLDLTYALRSGSRVSPYLLGGVGMYHVTISTTSGGATSESAATKLAWNLGGGMSYGVGAVAAFLEARYVSVAAVATFARTTLFPVSVGLRFGGR
jgi:opacity protein-like surface antigen